MTNNPAATALVEYLAKMGDALKAADDMVDTLLRDSLNSDSKLDMGTETLVVLLQYLAIRAEARPLAAEMMQLMSQDLERGRRES